MDITVIALALILFLVVFAIIQYNKLVRLNIQVDEGFSQIEVQLKRRADLIPNLVETVKGYATQEREVFERVVQARAASTTASTLPAVAAADGALTNALRGLLDLKSSTNFLQLQEELATTENKVSFARQFYNDTVRSLNTAVKTIPSSLFVGLAKVGEREFYEVDDPTVRNAPNVKF
jgi:LemA protein